MEKSVPLRVGFIGLGKMGTGIARNIQGAEFPLTVYNRTLGKMQALLDGGAVSATSPRDAAALADVVFTCLGGDESVLSILQGDNGLLSGLPTGAIHVGLSTVSPDCSSELARIHADHGTTYLAAPVLGRPDVAEAGKLRTFVAGDADAIARCTPVLETYTELVLPVGQDHSVASAMKVCANHAVISVIELIGQTYAFGEKSGIDPMLVNLLLKTLFPMQALQEYIDQIQARQFQPGGFAMSGGLKDVELFLKAAEDVGASFPFAGIIRDKMRTAMNTGLSDYDWSGIYEITRRQAGLE